MIKVRTYMFSFAHYHEWAMTDDAGRDRAKFAAWSRGQPWVDPDDGCFVIPFNRIPDRVVVGGGFDD